MASTGPREIRFLRISLAWVGVALLGVALLLTVFLGLYQPVASGGGPVQPGVSSFSGTASGNPLVWPVLIGSVACIAVGVIGLLTLRRSHRHSELATRRTA
jgi:hypothetical protein